MNSHGDLWTQAVGKGNRPHPELQARVLPKNAPPSFMVHWRPSEFNTLPPIYLAPDTESGTFLPRPTSIWGADDARKVKMLETLTAIWKLLLVRPCLFRRGDLAAKDAYLNAQAWRDILNRQKSDTTHSAMWKDGKVQLWGRQLQPQVARRVRDAARQEEIDARITSLERDILRLREERNASSPTAHLPPEILSRIFIIFADMFPVPGTS